MTLHINDDESLTRLNLNPNESFTLRATVRNQGWGEAAASTLTYYRSFDRIQLMSLLGTTGIAVLAAKTGIDDSIDLTAPSYTEVGWYYYKACVAPVAGELYLHNNCSRDVVIFIR